MDIKVQIISRISESIREATREGDFASVSILSELGKFVAPLNSDALTIVSDVFASDEKLGGTPTDHYANAGSISDQPSLEQTVPESPYSTRIIVKVEWSRAGIDHPGRQICEGKDSRTFVSLVEEIAEVMGERTLEQLSQIQTARGPLLSRRPASDYRMDKRGRIYTNHPVGTTGWYLLTHSDKNEKIALITRISRVLRLPDGTLTICSRTVTGKAPGGPVIRVIDDLGE